MSRLLAPLVLAIVATIYLSGCATPAKPQAMVVQPSTTTHAPPVNEALRNTFQVSGVTGGKGTNPLWMSKVDNASYQEALEKSLRIAGYLAPAGTEPVHVVAVSLKALKQLLIGLSFKVVSEVEYRITSPESEQVIPVTATGIATMGDALIGVTRLRMASENSINENIKAFLAKLSSL